jgi:hypothetical protein
LYRDILIIFDAWWNGRKKCNSQIDFDSVEILVINLHSLFGVPAHRALSPAALASSNIVITVRRLMKNPDERGGKGMLPAGCLPF